jgi:hypothetical protein
MSPLASWLLLCGLFTAALTIVIGVPTYRDIWRRAEWDRHTADALAAANERRPTRCDCGAQVYDMDTHRRLAHQRRPDNPEDDAHWGRM